MTSARRRPNDGGPLSGGPLSGGPLVLCYHAVSERWPCELAIPPRQLRHQLETLLRDDYRAVRFSELLTAPRGGKLLAVTFDDAFASTCANGLPVLRRLQIPASMFVPSDFVGASALAWPGVEQWLYGEFADELRPAGWAQLEQLVSEGWEIGSHSCSHAHLTQLSDAGLKDELTHSRDVLEARLHSPCRSFAYPFGELDDRVLAAVAAAGYEAAAALPIRLKRPTPLSWPRVGIYRTDGSLRFRAKVSPLVRSLRQTPLAAPMLKTHKLTLAATGGSSPSPPRRAPLVLITDAEERSIVAATRALGSSGYGVAAAASMKHAAAQCSRFCKKRILLPNPLLDEAGYVDALERTLRSGEYDVLIPGSDPALLIASENRERLQRHALIGLPPHQTVLRSLDKLALQQLARDTGLQVPETIVCESAEQARRAARELGYPVAIKPRSSAFRTKERLKHVPGRIAESEDELMHIAPAYGERFLLQRREEGTLLAFGGVFAGGRLLASAAARSLRTHRPGSGSLAFCESIPVAPLRESAAALMTNVRHEGIFELDLVMRRDGSLLLLDLNPRPYGAMALATAGGANLPEIWCDWLLSGDPPHRADRPLDGDPQPVDAEPGLKFRWGDADLFHMLCRAREGEWRAAASVLMPHRHVTHAYFSAGDPCPMLARALWLGKDLTRHGLADRRELTLRDV